MATASGDPAAVAQDGFESKAHFDRNALLEAVVGIAGDLDLRSTLERIVGAAARLVDARYAALGVLGPRGDSLAEFITVGIDQAGVELIGPYPHGRGILGLLITQPEPLRLHDLNRHPNAYGFPEHHPPMSSFLGVPIRVGEHIFGNLYLTEKRDGSDFTDEDEAAVVALAATAAVAIDNARLYEGVERRERWLRATAEIQRTLLGQGPLSDVLELVTDRASELADADLAVIIVEREDGRVVVRASSGAAAGELPAELPRTSVLLDVVERGATVELVSGLEIEGLEAFPVVVMVPFKAPAGAGGALLVASRRSRRLWIDRPALADHLGALQTFAAQASLAMDRAQAREDRAALVLQHDRDRIARDLHDFVIQRLFATGLSLQGSLRLPTRADEAERVKEAIKELDMTIRQIREAIFELGRDTDAPANLRGQIHDIVRSAEQQGNFRARLNISGPVESLVSDALREHVLAVLVECLSNVTRHAQAHVVLVDLKVDRDEGIVLVVADDGIGYNTATRESGLHNMRDRAEMFGGKCEVGSKLGLGTRVKWRVPARSIQSDG